MKKTILKITAVATFALLMAFNVTTTMNNTEFSLSGLKALASGTTVVVGCSSDAECGPNEICNPEGYCQLDPANSHMEETICPDGVGLRCESGGNGCDVSQQLECGAT